MTLFTRANIPGYSLELFYSKCIKTDPESRLMFKNVAAIGTPVVKLKQFYDFLIWKHPPIASYEGSKQ